MFHPGTITQPNWHIKWTTTDGWCSCLQDLVPESMVPSPLPPERIKQTPNGNGSRSGNLQTGQPSSMSLVWTALSASTVEPSMGPLPNDSATLFPSRPLVLGAGGFCVPAPGQEAVQNKHLLTVHWAGRGYLSKPPPPLPQSHSPPPTSPVQCWEFVTGTRHDIKGPGAECH